MTAATGLISTTAITYATSSGSTTGTFFNHLIETIDLAKIPEYEKKSACWRTAAIVIAIVLPLIAVGILTTAIFTFTSVFVITTGIVSIALISITIALYKIFNRFARQAEKETSQLKGIEEQLQKIDHFTPAEFHRLLWDQNHMIPTDIPIFANDPELKTIKPLLAFQRYLDERIGYFEGEKQKILNHLSSATATTFGRWEKVEWQQKALKFEYSMYQSKLLNSYLNAILRKPNHVGNLEELGQRVDLLHFKILISNDTPIPLSSHFFIFNNNAVDPLTFEIMRDQDIAWIGQRMATAMTN